MQSLLFAHLSNALRKNITEVGSLGSMRHVQKVPGFTRTLVSVRDLADQFAGVYFDKGHVYLVPECAMTNIPMHRIGDATANRLYTFNIKALDRCSGLLPQSHHRGCGA